MDSYGKDLTLPHPLNKLKQSVSHGISNGSFLALLETSVRQ